MKYKITASEISNEPLAGTHTDIIDADNPFNARNKFLEKHKNIKFDKKSITIKKK